MKFIAHRGYSARYPENSLDAFRAVIDHPCNGTSLIGIELDVHLTADGRLPVMHEVWVPDANGGMISVAECTFDGLQRLFHLQHNGTRPPVPDLPAVFDLVNHRTRLCIEIKEGPYNLDLFTQLFTDTVTTYKPENDLLISSFSPGIIDHVRSGLERFNIHYAWIFETFDAFNNLPSNVLAKFDQIHPDYRLILEDPVRFSSPLPPVRCWAVNDPDIVRSLIDTGVPIDAVMTDDIELARQFPEDLE